MNAPVRTLIVDDSPSMRAILRRILDQDPEIDVVGAAEEPHAARAMIKELNPDVITLDVEMPGMDGLSFLEKIMRLRPMPVVMCSTLTECGAAVSIEALRLGAVECIAKPSGKSSDLLAQGQVLRDTVKAAARASVGATEGHRPVVRSRSYAADRVIAIGASTGGVETLFSLLSRLPADCPPVLIVQHMPSSFTQSFARRLDKECAVTVTEAVDGQRIRAGHVYIAPGGFHMTLVGGADGHLRLRDSAPVSGHRPSVDVLFHSIARLGRSAVGVILTGMGSDGAEGLLAMRQAGAATFGQDRASCIIYGMPRAAAEIGAVAQQCTLSALPEAILAACDREKQE